MSETRRGVVILGDTFKKTAFVLEDGGEKKIHKFASQTVIGNIDEHDWQGRDFPARLRGDVVEFVLESDGTVLSVNFTGNTNHHAIKEALCEECATFCFSMAANNCACGNTKNSAHELCIVCAFMKDKCIACGE